MTRNQLALCVLVTIHAAGASAFPDEVRDVIFGTRYESGPPKTADLYYNGRAIGSGREAFQQIVDRLRALPQGTSIVWGPNYRQCGSCSGAEPDCVPKYLYPDLWSDLEKVVKDRRLILSSTFPGPWLRPVHTPVESSMPIPVTVAKAGVGPKIAAVLDWEVGGIIVDWDKVPEHAHFSGKRWHLLRAKGKPLGQYGLDLFLGSLANGSPVLVRITTAPDSGLTKDPVQIAQGAAAIEDFWRRWLRDPLRRSALHATFTAPEPIIAALRERARKRPLHLDWTNFRGPKTPHNEVVYLLNGEFAGRGDNGFDHVLASLDKTPSGSGVVLPQYELSGRFAIERYTRKELKIRNEQLRSVVPFADRRAEFEKRIAACQLELMHDRRSPGETETVAAWGDGGWEFILRTGRIVRHDERPLAKAAARLAWTGYPTGRQEERAHETTSIYTLDDAETGMGVLGFEAAVQRIAALPAGSVVQVRVCLRTKGPFVCPRTFEGHRHFERTGIEPYVGMLPWLVDVARTSNIELQWIPDEAESLLDCELNR